MSDRKTITATDGNILTNGVIYGTKIYLADDIDETKFREITLEEYNKISEVTEDE